MREVGPWVTMGVGALLLGGSAYTGFSAQRLYTQLDERRSQELAIVEGDIEVGNTFVLITNILISVGTLSLSAGGAWWAMQSADEVPVASAPPKRALSVDERYALERPTPLYEGPRALSP